MSYDDAVIQRQMLMSAAHLRPTQDLSESGEGSDTQELDGEHAAHAITTEESGNSDAESTTGDSDTEVSILIQFVKKVFYLRFSPSQSERV